MHHLHCCSMESSQGFGNLAAGIVGMVVSAAFTNSAPSNADFVWRIVLMFGAVPATLTYYWRMKMPETARYTALVAKDAKKVASDMSAVLNMHIVPEDEAVYELARHDQYGLFSAEFLRRHGAHLVGTSMCWLALDITFYSLNLFMKDFFTKVRLLGAPHQGDEPFKRMVHTTAMHTILVLSFSLPGYFFSVAFVDRIGRVRIQLLGFAMMSAFILCLAIPYDHWTDDKNNKYGFAVMYGLTSFFANFGPNTTTFIIPAEIFPARLRSTCHGISGAFGKLGAIIGVFAFVYAEKHNNNRSMLFALVGCNLVGLVFTLLLPEPKGKALEEISGEMEEQHPEQDAAAVAAAEYVNVVPV